MGINQTVKLMKSLRCLLAFFAALVKDINQTILLSFIYLFIFFSFHFKNALNTDTEVNVFKI